MKNLSTKLTLTLWAAAFSSLPVLAHEGDDPLLARVMIDQAMGGDIVYVASKNALFAGPNNVAYGASKADQAHQVRLLAVDRAEWVKNAKALQKDNTELRTPK